MEFFSPEKTLQANLFLVAVLDFPVPSFRIAMHRDN